MAQVKVEGQSKVVGEEKCCECDVCTANGVGCWWDRCSGQRRLAGKKGSQVMG